IWKKVQIECQGVQRRRFPSPIPNTQPAHKHWAVLMMFDGIDSIDWAKLSHSHGTAEQVPAQLDALTTGSEDARRKALDYFWEYMLHQGSRYEASPYVVRFLFEALEDPACLIQRELIDLLLALGVGYGESFLPFGYDLEEEERRFKGNQWG